MIKLAKFCPPWKEHLSELEREAGLHGSIKFVLYKESNSDKWRVQVSIEKKIASQPLNPTCTGILLSFWCWMHTELKCPMN